MSTLEHINVSLLNERDSVNEELLRVGARGRREAVDDAYTAELAAAEELSKRQKAETANKKLSLELTNARKACEGMRQQLAEMQRQMAQEASTSQLHETARAKRLAQRAAEVQDEEMEEEEEEEEEEEVDSDDDEDSDDEYIPPGKLVRFLTRAPTISSNPEQLSVLMLDPHDIPSLVRLSKLSCRYAVSSTVATALSPALAATTLSAALAFPPFAAFLALSPSRPLALSPSRPPPSTPSASSVALPALIATFIATIALVPSNASAALLASIAASAAFTALPASTPASVASAALRASIATSAASAALRASIAACITSAALAPFDAACIASATLPAMNAAFITSVALSCWKGKEAVFVSSCVLR